MNAREEFDYVVHHTRKYRSERARAIRAMLAVERKALSRAEVRAAIRTWLERDPPPEKANRGWFRRHAIAVLRDARKKMPWELARENGERWINPYDTETYSACGYEDGLLMDREMSQEYAPSAVAMYRIAVQELKS